MGVLRDRATTAILEFIKDNNLVLDTDYGDYKGTGGWNQGWFRIYGEIGVRVELDNPFEICFIYLNYIDHHTDAYIWDFYYVSGGPQLGKNEDCKRIHITKGMKL